MIIIQKNHPNIISIMLHVKKGAIFVKKGILLKNNNYKQRLAFNLVITREQIFFPNIENY